MLLVQRFISNGRPLQRAACLQSRRATYASRSSAAAWPAHRSSSAWPAHRNLLLRRHRSSVARPAESGAAASRPESIEPLPTKSGGHESSGHEAVAGIAARDEAVAGIAARDDDDDDSPVDLSRYLELVTRERSRIATGVALQGASSGLSLVLPYAIGQVVDGTCAGVSRKGHLAATSRPRALVAARRGPSGCAGTWKDGAVAATAASPWASPSMAAAGLFGVFGAQALIMVARRPPRGWSVDGSRRRRDR